MRRIAALIGLPPSVFQTCFGHWRVRNRKTQLLRSAIVVLLLAAFIYLTRVNDPVYEGKRLSEILATSEIIGLSPGVGISGGRLDNPPEPRILLGDSNWPALEAAEKVGVKALPLLVRLLKSEESRIGLWFWALAEKWKVAGKLTGLKPSDAHARRRGALLAFYQLGPRATSVIPDIIPLLDDPDLALEAMLAMMLIHPERESDILSLTNVLRIQTSSRSGASPSLFHSTAFLAIGSFGPKAAGAEPILLANLTSTNGRIQAAAAVALARIGAPAEKVVPLILQHLPTTNPSPTSLLMDLKHGFTARDFTLSVMMNIWALGEYGQRARAALPILSNLQNYPVVNIKDAAKEAAAKILADTNHVSR